MYPVAVQSHAKVGGEAVTIEHSPPFWHWHWSGIRYPPGLLGSVEVTQIWPVVLPSGRDHSAELVPILLQIAYLRE